MSMGIFDGKRYFVYGDGASGRAACRALRKNGGKAKIYTDECGAFAEPQKANYDGAVISPGIRPTHAVYDYCARNGIETLSEAELGFMLAKTPIVGVTGTNGKTTVTRLIAGTSGIRCLPPRQKMCRSYANCRVFSYTTASISRRAWRSLPTLRAII